MACLTPLNHRFLGSLSSRPLFGSESNLKSLNKVKAFEIGLRSFSYGLMRDPENRGFSPPIFSCRRWDNGATVVVQEILL